ncbi:MAG TPA: histidine kinase dimerization/phospho-acceptor domain-containing protein, partial [Bryobacteraceae bacterium]|nr:histidine kinase dimerization/phospho-acceptor domain-containing protein [Bryobacteraceae bacterium]
MPHILYRRAILVYLAVIVVPALVLLYLGLQSVKRQNEAISALRASNLRLSQERLEEELERRTALLAETCLREAAAVTGDHARLEQVRRQHTVARHFFVLTDDTVRYPLLRTPPPRLPAGLPAEFHQAEAAEHRENRTAEALAAYRGVLEMETSDPVKALALSRVARCLQKLRRTNEAAQAWRTLLEKYGDLRDPSYRPYALVAAFELGQERSVYEDIVQGRWELSAGQVDYFLERLERPASASLTNPLDRFEFARAVEDNFHHAGPLRPDEVYRLDLPPYQLYYLLLSPGSNPETLLGLSVNSAWVEKELVPQIRDELGIAEQVPPAGERSLLLYGGATGLVLGVLIMGVVLMIRDVTRETRVNQLRAEFVSGVSHELRTPLTLIRLYGDTLLEGGEFAEEERRGFYRIITRESERLTHLIEKVLTFSRIERGEKQYRLEEGDLAPVVARTVEPYE